MPSVVISPPTKASPVVTKRFAGDARVLVLRENGIQHCIRNLVADLVRMSFGHGLGGKQI